jgi:hypothetical protein
MKYVQPGVRLEGNDCTADSRGFYLFDESEGHGDKNKEWGLESSIFESRSTENESRDYVDKVGMKRVCGKLHSVMCRWHMNCIIFGHVGYVSLRLASVCQTPRVLSFGRACACVGRC